MLTSNGYLPEKIGKYHIIRKAGSGGFGEVFEGWDNSFKRNVAIKVLNPEAIEDLRRFEREARVIARLASKLSFVVQVYEFVESPAGGTPPYLVEEFLSGVDLKTRIQEGDQIPPWLRLKYLKDIARGLAAVHGEGIVHRDLKPANIRVLHNHEIKLMDFGLAKVVSEETLAKTAGILGSPSYAAPEQGLEDGFQDVDHRADIFSFGIIAYELLGGENPFAAKDWRQYFHKLLHVPPPPLVRSWPDCPENLNEILQNCLQRRPEKRPEVAEILKALTKQLDSKTHFRMPALGSPKDPAAKEPLNFDVEVDSERSTDRLSPKSSPSVSATVRGYLPPETAHDPSVQTAAQSARPQAVGALRWRWGLSLTTVLASLLSIAWFMNVVNDQQAADQEPENSEIAEIIEPEEGLSTSLGPPILKLEAHEKAIDGLTAIELSGFLSGTIGKVGVCYIGRSPDWGNDIDKLRKNCWQSVTSKVHYLDKNAVSPATEYTYIIKLLNEEGEMMLTSESVSVTTNPEEPL